jgi:hypothetical protein
LSNPAASPTGEASFNPDLGNVTDRLAGASTQSHLDLEIADRE